MTPGGRFALAALCSPVCSAGALSSLLLLLSAERLKAGHSLPDCSTEGKGGLAETSQGFLSDLPTLPTLLALSWLPSGHGELLRRQTHRHSAIPPPNPWYLGIHRLLGCAESTPSPDLSHAIPGCFPERSPSAELQFRAAHARGSPLSPAGPGPRPPSAPSSRLPALKGGDPSLPRGCRGRHTFM